MSSDSASILVVEDDDFYREYLGELLKSRGLEVRWLADGSVVCRQVEGEPPDLIILDLFMTGRDGISITRCVTRFSSALPPASGSGPSGSSPPVATAVDELGDVVQMPG